MLFNSLEYLIFMPMALAMYFALPARHRWIFLLIASYYFYMCWKVEYVYLLIASTVTDYVCGLRIQRTDDPRVRRRYLYASLVLNLGLLFTYKYYDFLNGSLRGLFASFGWNYPLPDLGLTLPVGISFYTFQTLGYTIDVYKKRIEAEASILRFALYVTYFPQLVAGPIERAKNLVPQLRQHFEFDYARVRDGLSLVVWGLFKKVVIADRIAEYTTTVFSNPGAYKGLQIWLADYLFVIQLYCDFSGYTDIALGTAAIMGVKLMENFRQPLLSMNVGDLWSRWHISLTTWFRDYLYVLVGGRRASKARMNLGILVVFLANGLWHGAAWTFVLFGLMHGVCLVAYYALRKSIAAGYRVTGLDRLPRLGWLLGNIATMLVFMIGGNFFRALSVEDSWTLMRNMLDFSGGWLPLNLYRYPGDMWITLTSLVLLYATEWLGEHRGLGAWLQARPRAFRWLLMAAGIFLIMLLGKWDAVNFIYFQF